MSLTGHSRTTRPTSRVNWPYIATVAEMYDAEFIRCAADDVRLLLAKVDRLRALVQRDEGV